MPDSKNGPLIEAHDYLVEARNKPGPFPDVTGTKEDLLKMAQVAALIGIGQELEEANRNKGPDVFEGPGVITIRDTDLAFEEAIRAAIFTPDEAAGNWLGHFMYMYTAGGLDYFKHIMTRKYLTSLAT